MKYSIILGCLLLCGLCASTIEDAPPVIVKENIKTITSLETDYTSIANEVAKSVVEVRTFKYNGDSITSVNQYFEPQELNQPLGLGSGFIIDPLGYIVTNHHVVDGGNRYYVVLSDGREIEAKLIGVNKNIDVAVLQISKEYCTAIKIGDSSLAKTGDIVFAFGSPLGLQDTVTAGIVSAHRSAALNGYLINYIQSDVAINHGNSGGPMINAKGEFIGINNFLVSSVNANIGLGFALPSNLVMIAVADILHQDRQMCWIGAIIDAQRSGDGVLVLGIVPNSPAEKAGLKAGDWITECNGIKLESSIYLKTILAHASHYYELVVKIKGDKESRVLIREPEAFVNIASITSLEQDSVIDRTHEEAISMFYSIASTKFCAYHNETPLLHCQNCTAAKSDITYILKMITNGHSKKVIEMCMNAPVNLTVWLDFSDKETLAQYKTCHEMVRLMGTLVRIQIRHFPSNFTPSELWRQQADIFESLRAIAYEQEFLDKMCMGLTFDQALDAMCKKYPLVKTKVDISVSNKNYEIQLRNDYDDGFSVFQTLKRPYIQVNKQGTLLTEEELKSYIYNYLLSISL